MSDLGVLAGLLKESGDEETDFEILQGEVISVQAAGTSITISLRGDSTPIPGIRSMVPVIANDTIWVLKKGTFLLVINHQDTGWHVVGQPGEPAFQNGWTNYGGTWRGAVFRKTSGIVKVQGLVIHAAGNVAPSIAFTLPAGYRPGADIMFAAASSNGSELATRVDVTSAGDVRLGQGLPSGSGYFSMTGISFPAEL